LLHRASNTDEETNKYPLQPYDTFCNKESVCTLVPPDDNKCVDCNHLQKRASVTSADFRAEEASHKAGDGGGGLAKLLQ
jgi:hypothetical protein